MPPRRSFRVIVYPIIILVALAVFVTIKVVSLAKQGRGPAAPATVNMTYSQTDNVTGNVNPANNLLQVTEKAEGTLNVSVVSSPQSFTKIDIPYDNHLTLDNAFGLNGVQSTASVVTAKTYNVIGNVRIQPTTANGLLAGAVDPLGGTITVSGPATSTQNGNVSVNADGSFSYNPAPGFTGTDTFNAIATTASGGTTTINVTLNVGNGTATPGANVIWFVNPNAVTNGDGRLTSPFNCYTTDATHPTCFSNAAADDPGDTIFLYSGNASGGNTLLNNQRLIGQGATATLLSITGFTLPTDSDALPATGGTRPTITTLTATSGVFLGSGNTLRGFDIGNTGTTDITGLSLGASTFTASEIALTGTGRTLDLQNGPINATFDSLTSSSGAGGPGLNLNNVSGSLTVTNGVSLTSSGSQGISMSGVTAAVTFGSTTVTTPTNEGILISGTTASIGFGNTSITGGTDGVSFTNNNGGTRTFGTLSATGGSGNAFKNVKGANANGGGNVTVTGAATLTSAGTAVNVADMIANSAINFQSSVAATSTGSGNTGVALSGTNGAGSTITFNALSVTTNAGTGMNLAGSGTVNVTNASLASPSFTSAINSSTQAAPAIIANGIALNANFTTVNSSGGANGISLTNVTGTSGFGSGALSGATSDEFLVSGQSGTFTYNGTISSGSAHSVNVTGKNGGTLSLGGLVTDTDTGISLTSNTGATVAFTGGISASTGTNTAFTATGGGTISATQNNSSVVNTLTTSTGQALNVNGTTIGGSGLTFRSISVGSAGGTNNAISLVNAGTGGFTITGDGTTNAGTGGTINGKTGSDGNDNQGVGIYINNTSNISLTNVNFVGPFDNYGIRGYSINNLLLQDSNFSGTAGTTSAGANLEGNVRLNDTYGAVTFKGDTFFGAFTDNVRMDLNVNQTLNLTFEDSAAHQEAFNGNNTSSGNNGITVITHQDSNLFMLVNGVDFTSWHATGIITQALDTSNNEVTISNNNFHEGQTPVSAGGVAMIIEGTGGGPSWGVDYSIVNNQITGSSGSAIQAAFVGGMGLARGFISGNTVGSPNIAGFQSGLSQVGVSGGGAGIDVAVERDPASPNAGLLQQFVTIQNNTLADLKDGFGIRVRAANGSSSTNNSVVEATVTGNVVKQMAGNVKAGFYGLAGGNDPDFGKVGLDIRNNTFDVSDPAVTPNKAYGPMYLDQIFNTSSFYYIPGYAGTQGESYGGNAGHDLSTFYTTAPRSNTLINNSAPITGDPSYLVWAQDAKLQNLSLQPAQTGSNTQLPPIASLINPYTRPQLGARDATLALVEPRPLGGSAVIAYAPLRNSLSDYAATIEFTAAPRAVLPAEERSSLIAELYERLTASIEPTAYAQNNFASVMPNATAGGGTITANGGGAGFTIPAGGSFTIKYRAVLNAPAAGTGFENGFNAVKSTATATFNGGGTQTQAANDLNVDANPDLSLSVSDGNPSTQPGFTNTYTFTYGNGLGSAANNLQDAAGAKITVPQPANTTFNAGSDSGWACAAGSCTLTVPAAQVVVNTTTGQTTKLLLDVATLPTSPAATMKIDIASAAIAENPVNANGAETAGQQVNNTALTDSDNLNGVWTGLTSVTWATAGNWSNSVVPSSTDNVAIVSGGGASSPTITDSRTVNNLYMATAPTAKNITVTSPGLLTVNGLLSLGIAQIGGTGSVTFGDNATSTFSVGPPSGRITCPVTKTFTNSPVADGVDGVNAPTGPQSITFTFPVGDGSGTYPVDATVASGSTGSLTVTSTTSGSAGTVPPLDNTKTLQRFWTLSSTGSVTSDLKFTYGTTTTVNGTEANYRPQRVSGGASTSFPDTCTPGTGCVDETNNFIFVPNISVFAGNWTASDFVSSTTAAEVDVSGRVTTAGGIALRGVRVTLDDGTGHPVTTVSNAFGYYHFDAIPSGVTYLVSASARGMAFTPRVVVVNDQLTDLDLTALP